jgi:signal peptidase II
LLRSWPHVVTVLGIAVTAVVVYYFHRHAAKSLVQAAVFGMILGGAIGNLADRVLFGQVRDFLDFRIFGYMWPTFNVADTCVSVGAVMLGLRILFAGKSKPGTK